MNPNELQKLLRQLINQSDRQTFTVLVRMNECQPEQFNQLATLDISTGGQLLNKIAEMPFNRREERRR